MVIAVIDEVKNLDSSTDVNDSIEDANDFLVTVFADTVVNSLELRHYLHEVCPQVREWEAVKKMRSE